MKIPVLFENKDYVIINKPAGLVIHSDGKTKEESVSDWIMEKYPEIKEVGEPWTTPTGEVIYRPGIVHRIDRETSGVLVIAKNQESYEFLKEKFQKREVSKTYHAFVYGKVALEEGMNAGVIDRPIGKSTQDFRLWSAQRGARGVMRDAVTRYNILIAKEEYSLLEVMPLTGRTHQIRVHMKAINHPVVCDSLYAPKREKALGFERLALHALSLSFIDKDGTEIKVEAPYPEDFEKAKKLLEKTS